MSFSVPEFALFGGCALSTSEYVFLLFIVFVSTSLHWRIVYILFSVRNVEGRKERTNEI
jgi:hypothetical protein